MSNTWTTSGRKGGRREPRARAGRPGRRGKIAPCTASATGETDAGPLMMMRRRVDGVRVEPRRFGRARRSRGGTAGRKSKNCVCTSLGPAGAFCGRPRARPALPSHSCFTRRAEQPRNLTGAPACNVQPRPPIARLRAAASQLVGPWRPSERLPIFCSSRKLPRAVPPPHR